MKAKQLMISLVLALLISTGIYGQTDIYGLKLYGFFQTSFLHEKTSVVSSYIPNDDKTHNSFWTQQMNIFLSKDINDHFSTFINFEFTNTYSSKKNWGAFSIEEAWIKYSRNNLINIKGGLFIPSFNNLNEIKNRTILLPYIFRPFVYETQLGSTIPLSAFVPQSANLGLYGNLPLNELKFNYSIYVGNSEDSYTETNVTPNGTASVDTSKFKLVGGRVGLHYNSIKFGISGTFDRTNQSANGVGDVSRMRIGADLSFSLAGFKWESEYIKVKHSLKDTQEAQLLFLNSMSPFITTSLDKEFYYAALSYDITDNIYMYGKYDNIKDEAAFITTSGVKGYSIGGGYKPADDILLKIQYQKVECDNPNIFKLNIQSFYAGASIFF